MRTEQYASLLSLSFNGVREILLHRQRHSKYEVLRRGLDFYPARCGHSYARERCLRGEYPQLKARGILTMDEDLKEPKPRWKSSQEHERLSCLLAKDCVYNSANHRVAALCYTKMGYTLKRSGRRHVTTSMVIAVRAHHYLNEGRDWDL